MIQIFLMKEEMVEQETEGGRGKGRKEEESEIMRKGKTSVHPPAGS